MERKKSALILQFPKKQRPLPPHAIPGAELAAELIEAAKQAHQEELQQERRKLRYAMRVIALISKTGKSR